MNGARPAFEMEGGWLLAMCRAVWLVGLFGAFGGLMFRVAIVPRGLAALPAPAASRAEAALRRLIWASLGVALLGGGAWLGGTAANLVDADTLRDALSAVPPVLIATRFGHVLLLQAACGGVATAVLAGIAGRIGRLVALAAMAASVGLQVWHGHAGASGDALLVIGATLHVLAAAAWLGTLPALLLFVALAPPRASALAARRYSPLGQGFMVALVLGAGVQALALIGTIPALFGTAYGLVALAKLCLFGALTGFALANRYWFGPDLLRSRPERARRVLLCSLTAQTGVGLMVVLAAAVINTLPPAVHEQPVWPFTVGAGLGVPREAAEFDHAVIWSTAALVGALVLLLAAAIRHRSRRALKVGPQKP